MSRKTSDIGFDRHLELNWLDAVASWASADYSEQEISERFTDLLATIDQGDEARKKNRTVLTRVWLRVPIGMEGFQQTGLDLFHAVSSEQRTAVHYGRCMAAYPFFAFVSTQVGRLLALQGDILSSDVYRRVIERYGDRSRVRRSAQHVLSTLNAWHILTPSVTRKYVLPRATAIQDAKLISWLVEAHLRSADQPSGRLLELLSHPVLFPFQLRPLTSGELLRANPRLDTIQQGLSDEIIVLR